MAAAAKLTAVAANLMAAAANLTLIRITILQFEKRRDVICEEEHCGVLGPAQKKAKMNIY